MNNPSQFSVFNFDVDSGSLATNLISVVLDEFLKSVDDVEVTAFVVVTDVAWI